jgi:hypothetical protein
MQNNTNIADKILRGYQPYQRIKSDTNEGDIESPPNVGSF